ncbi:MAG: nuclear transport factor 2 family protein [Ramlibacter sp.]|nr:nuclear transport factor 2 family protein [Ramlibacter sp.]MCW5651775.1 nuclear transport factor 2 family protein [Ramlibacter sp.]
MPPSRLQAATLGGTADDIEALFYEALQAGDIHKLMTCWADEDEIVCVHPGGPRLVGSGVIRAAFETLFAHGGVRASPMRVRKVESLASAVHNVLERIEVATPDGAREAWVIATNVYHKTAQGWRLVAHHASPGTPSEMQEVAEAPPVLH